MTDALCQETGHLSGQGVDGRGSHHWTVKIKQVSVSVVLCDSVSNHDQTAASMRTDCVAQLKPVEIMIAGEAAATVSSVTSTLSCNKTGNLK